MSIDHHNDINMDNNNVEFLNSEQYDPLYYLVFVYFLFIIEIYR